MKSAVIHPKQRLEYPEPRNRHYAPECFHNEYYGYPIRSLEAGKEVPPDFRFEVRSVESVVAKVPGIFDLHIRRGNFQRYYCGADAKGKQAWKNHLYR